MSDIQKTKTREEFIIDIKKWALLDSQLKIVNDKTKYIVTGKQIGRAHV